MAASRILVRLDGNSEVKHEEILSYFLFVVLSTISCDSSDTVSEYTSKSYGRFRIRHWKALLVSFRTHTGFEAETKSPVSPAPAAAARSGSPIYKYVDMVHMCVRMCVCVLECMTVGVRV